MTLSASAAPGDPVRYPTGATVTRAKGLAFDTCTAPPVSTMRAWLDSPYRTVNVYVAGINRGCRQPELTASWVQAVTELGYRILPTVMGTQPQCMFGTKRYRFTLDTARAAARDDARDAIAQARAVGFLPGSALYADIEHYDVRNADCHAAVQRYLVRWVREVHRAGYLAGAYLHLYSGLPGQRDVYTSTRHPRLDAVWVARWDGSATLTGWDGIPDTMWAGGQRIKQYRGGHDERWGGVTVNIDNDVVNAPMATVARRMTVQASGAVNVRELPRVRADVLRQVQPGAALPAVCRTIGSTVGEDRRWVGLAGGGYVHARLVGTSSAGTLPSRLPVCRHGFQVDVRAGAAVRTAPRLRAPAVRVLPDGAMAWVHCQSRRGPRGAKTWWSRITPDRWVANAALATGVDGRSPGMPGCWRT